MDIFAGANLNKQKFNALRSPNDRMLFLGEIGAEYLGHGSSRAAYIVSSKKALKLSLSPAGTAQNKQEYNFLKENQGPYFPKVYDCAPDYTWIEVELVRPITEGQFQSYFQLTPEAANKLANDVQHSGANSFHYYYGYKMDLVTKTFEALAESGADQSAIDELNETVEELEKTPENVCEFIDYCLDKDLILTEVFRVDNLGMNSSRELVILDLGLTQDIFSEFYATDKMSQKHPDGNFPSAVSAGNGLPENFIYEIPEDLSDFSSKDPKNVLPNMADLFLKKVREK